MTSAVSLSTCIVAVGPFSLPGHWINNLDKCSELTQGFLAIVKNHILIMLRMRDLAQLIAGLALLLLLYIRTQ